jgi:hypothetical protein
VRGLPAASVRLTREDGDVCCFLLALFALGPRFVLAVVFAHWWWPALGIVLAPWTTLMYTIVWTAGGVHGANWIAVAFGAFLDLLSYSGRGAQKMYAQRSAA